MTMADELLKLHTLHQQGGLTDEEFAAAKKRVFDGEPAPEPPKYVRPQSSMKLFQRSLTDRWIGGVCGGLDDVSGIPAWSWRILFILLALLHGVGLVLYILLWIFVPLRKPALPAPATVIITPPPAPPASTPPPVSG